MAEIKLTKNQLRTEQKKLTQLRRYLPTLQLKKAMLQLEVSESRQRMSLLQKEYFSLKEKVEQFSSLLVDIEAIDLQNAVVIETVHKRYENIAGVEVPLFEGVDFAPFSYRLFEAPSWVDGAMLSLRKVAEKKAAYHVEEEKKLALEKEHREVSIRVNLFEKVLIPRSEKNIKKIKVFLGDQELAAVAQAKVAKTKIESNKSASKKESSHAY